MTLNSLFVSEAAGAKQNLDSPSFTELVCNVYPLNLLWLNFFDPIIGSCWGNLVVPLHFLCELFCAEFKESYLSSYLMTWRKFVTVWSSERLCDPAFIFSWQVGNFFQTLPMIDVLYLTHQILASPFFKHFLHLTLKADIILRGARKPRGGGSGVRFVFPTVLTLEPRALGSLAPDGLVFVSKRKKNHLQHLPQNRLFPPGIQVSVLHPVQGQSSLESRCG